MNFISLFLQRSSALFRWCSQLQNGITGALLWPLVAWEAALWPPWGNEGCWLGLMPGLLSHGLGWQCPCTKLQCLWVPQRHLFQELHLGASCSVSGTSLQVPELGQNNMGWAFSKVPTHCDTPLSVPCLPMAEKLPLLTAGGETLWQLIRAQGILVCFKNTVFSWFQNKLPWAWLFLFPSC